MNPFILLILFSLVSAGAHAKSEIDPAASFGSEVNISSLVPLGVGKDRKFTCRIIGDNQNFILNNSQAYAVCWPAQVACARWGLMKNTPESHARQFIFDGTEAYLLTCALMIIAADGGASILETVGYAKGNVEGEEAVLTTSDPVTQNAKNARSGKKTSPETDEPPPINDPAEQALKEIPI